MDRIICREESVKVLCTPLMRLPPPQVQNHYPMGIMYIGAWEQSNEKDICHVINSDW
jgi:hypothetical protein